MKQKKEKKENGAECFVTPKKLLERISEHDKKLWITDALQKATPVAKRWANYSMKEKHLNFTEIEDMFFEIHFIENSLYEGLRKNLLNHIGRHGLDARGLEFMRMFEDVSDFNFHKYEAVLRKIRKAFAHNSRNVENLKKQLETTRDYELKRKRELELADLKRESDDLEYLIAKINEFLRKMHDLSNKGFELLLAGEAPNLNAWKNQALLNDRLFEENKQFLKQTLHHIDTLQESLCKLGIAEIRLLLYHKDGCRRQKLQKMVEENVITIFNQLESEEERKTVYPEICDFVSQIVPAVGYISPLMVSFIFDRGFVSSISRDLLLKLKPVIMKLNMTPLLATPLQRYLQTTLHNLRTGQLTETDEYVLELTQAYMPKSLTDDVMATWQELQNISQTTSVVQS